MTPEESDARLRKIHQEWRQWCADHPLPDLPESDIAVSQGADEPAASANLNDPQKKGKPATTRNHAVS
jgi:hypothetical protein